LLDEFQDAHDKKKFCERLYLDEKAMSEIENVEEQLEEIVSGMGVPILGGGRKEDYLCAVGRALIQFVCVRTGRDIYRSLTAERIMIHPGSVMWKSAADYIVAGEIVRTARMYASSVSPLSRAMVEKIASGSRVAMVLEKLKPQSASGAVGKGRAPEPKAEHHGGKHGKGKHLPVHGKGGKRKRK
jgi:hypothetical protein